MSLHGEIKVNGQPIGVWNAQNAGRTARDGIYRCRVEYADLYGEIKERFFFVMHNYSDGALVLTAKVMLESARQMDEPQYSETTQWHSFATEHDLNPYEALGRHITLKE